MRLTQANVAEDGDASLDVAEVERIVEARHGVAAHLCDLGHLAELLGVAGNEVEEGEPVKVLCALVRDFDDLGPVIPCQDIAGDQIEL